MAGMKLSLLLLLLMLSSSMSRVYLTPGGGYQGIVVKIDSKAAEEDCQKIIESIKVKQ